MQKEILTAYGGINARVSNLLVNRLLPNKHIQAIGPFIFLDHFYPTIQEPTTPELDNSKFSHPRRGISTFTYVLNGAIEYFDSRGNNGIADEGGVQWMKAGSGIHLYEAVTDAFKQKGGLLHLLQFWINLPAKNKNDAPEYMNIQAYDVPELLLPGDAGKLRILIGTYGITSSSIKTFTQHFLYHIKLNPKSAFTLNTKVGFEYAAFVPTDEVTINSISFGKSELIIFKQDEGDMVINNNNISKADIIIFGGEPYTEPIVIEGPFVMNTGAEICEAYRDFHLGKYGKISYPIKGITNT